MVQQIAKMKVIGLIGGMSWVSTIDYYRTINQLVNEQCGGLNSARIVLCSVNFECFKRFLDRNDWAAIAGALADAARMLETAGAECIVICSNTPHKVANEVQRVIGIPLIHIADETAKRIAAQKLKKVALLGTHTTMEGSFFRERLAARQIETLTPFAEDRQFIHEAVFQEFGKGIFLPATKIRFIKIVNELISMGAEGIVLGCTEFAHLLKEKDCIVPLFDTTQIHAGSAVQFSLGMSNMK